MVLWQLSAQPRSQLSLSLRLRVSLFPIAIEAGGRWHPASRGHVCTYLQMYLSESPTSLVARAVARQRTVPPLTKSPSSSDSPTAPASAAESATFVESVGRALASYQASFVFASVKAARSW